MKEGYRIILIVLLISYGTARATTYSEILNDSVVYVWDFKVSDASLKEIGNTLTNDFETELIKSGLYTVLERRRYNRVLAHREMENQINEIQKLSESAMDSLRSVKAGAVIFGEVKDDINSGQFEVIVTFQNLNEVILRKGSILISRGLIADNQTRKDAMKELVDILHLDELMAAKRMQYEVVSELVSTYMVRVKDVQKEFKDVGELALKDPAYFEELNNIVLAYNDIFNNLIKSGAKITADFTRHWGQEYGIELSNILSGILNDIHKTHILKLDKVRIEIAKFRESKLSKGEKKKWQDEIKKNVNLTVDDLGRQIDIMDIKINTFLSHLNRDMNK